MRFALFLALKYLKPKRSVASAITIVSILGVMLGVAVVIIVRSVMTGFGDIWEEKILDFKPHISIVSAEPGHLVHDEEHLAEAIRGVDGVLDVTPEIDTRVLLSHEGKVLAPALIGIDGERFVSSYKVDKIAGTFDLAGDAIVLGKSAAEMLGIVASDVENLQNIEKNLEQVDLLVAKAQEKGDTKEYYALLNEQSHLEYLVKYFTKRVEVVVYSPRTLTENDEVYLPIKWKVVGIFSAGQHEYDSGYAVASLPNVRDLMGVDKGVFAVHVKTANPTNPTEFSRICRDIQVPETCKKVTWQEADRQIFNALAVEKNMTALLLSLISLVAIFCVMNTLLVLSVQKTPEIGLLRAIGFKKRQIMSVFVVHGLIQCVLGIILGLLASYAILSNLQNIVDALNSFGLEVFPASVYGLDGIPHRLIVSDVVWVVGSVFVFGLMASLIPAIFAANKDPVKALNE